MEVTRTLKLWRRQLYSLRSYVPGLRRRHKLESLVGPLGFWDQLQAYQLRAVTELGLRPEHALLDIGCGPLQGGIAFIRYLDRERYVGLDHNPRCIEIGSEELSKQRLWAKAPRLFLCGDFGDEQLGDAKFDFIWLSQVLYYFDEPTFHKLFGLAQCRLRPNGIMAGDILGPESDRGFLRDPKPPAHTAESLDGMARTHGLMVTPIGKLSEFGYPKRLGLSRNVLLKISRI